MESSNGIRIFYRKEDAVCFWLNRCGGAIKVNGTFNHAFKIKENPKYKVDGLPKQFLIEKIREYISTNRQKKCVITVINQENWDDCNETKLPNRKLLEFMENENYSREEFFGFYKSI